MNKLPPLPDVLRRCAALEDRIVDDVILREPGPKASEKRLATHREDKLAFVAAITTARHGLRAGQMLLPVWQRDLPAEAWFVLASQVGLKVTAPQEGQS